MATAQTLFFATVQSFAKPYVKTAFVAQRDPLQAAKVKFGKVADEQIKLVKSAAEKSFWFKKLGDGYVITLKNGAAAINREQPAFAVGSAADAVKFLEHAKTAAALGEFDELFKATARAPRKLKAADPKLNEPEVASAPATPKIAPVAAKRARK